MKKVLLGTAAVALGLIFSAPAAKAEVKLDLAGHMKGYVFYTDQDGSDYRKTDILRETEIHFTGETTLDNGLTVGVHTEADIDSNDGSADAFTTEESYAYFSGNWGRVNFGKEDGAAYLLQVAAPSADDNFDGLRQYVNPFNFSVVALGATNEGFLDYANDVSGDANKITYLSPVFSGFQAGISYTPELTAGSQSIASNLDDSVADDVGSVWDAAVRYDGQFDNVGFTVGGGYERGDNEDATAGVGDDTNQWNVGLDLNWSAFGLGAVYTTTNNGLEGDNDTDTWVVGGDYTTGPYKLGISYLDRDNSVGTDVDTQRYTGGVVYTYGPGLTFRGSVSYVDYDVDGGTDVNGTSVLLGTQINF